ncbi:Transcription factor [Coemansia guatemalensis]|uniref:Transcription factor n=1 Tax=Coemansia guatemalensis TaxID=2761395 RepID=A0A9W8I149_9FUNG|nr:Transcription factor [Coemansia guatemalensis]
MKQVPLHTGPRGNRKRPGNTRTKRQKVSKACVYCQRSHMSCDYERPCLRCIKRGIGGICHDKELANDTNDDHISVKASEVEGEDDARLVDASPDKGPEVGDAARAPLVAGAASSAAMSMVASAQLSMLPSSVASMPANAGPYIDQQTGMVAQGSNGTNGAAHNLPLSGTMPMLATGSPLAAIAPVTPVGVAPDGGRAGGEVDALHRRMASQFNRNSMLLFGNDVASNEFTALNEFLEGLQRGMASTDQGDADIRMSNPPSGPPSEPPGSHAVGSPEVETQRGVSDAAAQTITQLMAGRPGEGVTQTERFLLTAADPNDGTSEDKLRQIINAKYEAGILKPYNYVNGYARMQRFMETNISRSNIVRILEVLNTFRPTFRSIAQTLTDIDLLLVEEGFERLLLDYDNVFNSFGVPACLWRRTGEIYKANREFADLVGVPLSYFHEGRVCIYEIMSESSTVNYWEKYGEIAFDATQKAVLTSCVLQTAASVRTLVQRGGSKGLGDSRPMSSSRIALKINGIADQPAPSQPGRPVRCCFSFTLRRDKHKIPLGIIGNFIPIP